MRASCSGRLADDRPMSRLSDSSLIRVRSIILMLLLIQMANMSNLSLCQYNAPDFRLPVTHAALIIQFSAMLHLLLYVVKRQLAICFKSLKPIQIGLCMLTSFSIHLHGLHLDAQCGQTQLRSGERTGRRLLWSTTLLLTLLSHSQVPISLVIHGL